MIDEINAEGARAIVSEFLTKRWGETEGTLYVGHVWEDEDGFLVEWGAREYLVDGDVDYVILSNLALIVNRWTGLVEEHVASEIWRRVAAMKPLTGGQ